MDIWIVVPTRRGMSGGCVKYLQEVVPRLLRDERVANLLVALPPTYVPTFAHLAPDCVYSIREAMQISRSSGAHSAPRLRGLFRPQIVWSVTSRLAPLRGVPQVIMFRNMEPPLIPFWANPFAEAMRNIARWIVARDACRRADGVIAVSQFVRDFLVERWGVEAEKVATIYHGVYVPSQYGRALESADSSLPYVFTAGSIRPARGLEDALMALARLAASGYRIPLCVAGSVDQGMSRYFCRLQRLAESLGIDSQMQWLGTLQPDDVWQRMRRCRVFLVTSRAEACPNTVLEAMAAGCTIVSTMQPPMPELLGRAALFYPPGNAEILADQIMRAYHEPPEVRRQRALSAIHRARTFSWDRTAHETLQFLARISRRRIARPSMCSRKCA